MPPLPPETEGVLPDSNVLIAFFERRDRNIAAAMERLSEAGRVSVVQPVRFEVLRGLRRRHQYTTLKGRLSKYPLITPTAADWEEATALARKTAATRGRHAVQLADLLLAAVAKRLRFAVWTRDPDFPRRIVDQDPAVPLLRVRG